MRPIRIFILAVFLTACNSGLVQYPLNPIGDNTVTIFEKTRLYFDLSLKDNSNVLNDDIIRLDAGRVILKKIRLPQYTIQPTVKINLELQSNGDPWDKSGSLFIIPAKSDLSLIEFETGQFDLSAFNQAYPASTPIKIDDQTYSPNVELLRFMTPFGVGYFSNSKRAKERKPIYVPKWEEKVNWTQDITHLLPLLEQEVYVGVFIDTWSDKGFKLSANIEYEESKSAYHKVANEQVIPLLNTVKYAADQKLFDGVAKDDVSIDFYCDGVCKDAELYYITTGHGGHSGGDEFTKTENIISIDGDMKKTFTPWRDDCASFRRFNPTSGMWVETVKYNGEDIDERIASSDFSRSNWCPGSDVAPIKLSLGDLETGLHTLNISLPTAQKAKEKENNYWMISAYLIYAN